jgi:NTE family protein
MTRLGLVLGAGGVVGASWLMGALEALEDETGWRATEAERIVGTSAGSVVGAMLADGLEPALMTAYSAGRSLDAYAEAEARAGAFAEKLDDVPYRLHRGLPHVGPGSLPLAARTLLRPHRHPPGHLLAAVMPRGFISTEPIQDVVRRFVRDGWPEHPGYRAVAADLDTGRRTVFGDAGAPPATAAEAVAASCSIPGFYAPVRIAGRSYVDGGICSVSNLDAVRGLGLDLVVCLNPMTSRAAIGGRSPADRFAGLMRAAAGRRLGHEARKLREEGTRVLLLQPSRDCLDVMGANLMARDRRIEVMEQARRNTAFELRRVRATQAGKALMPPPVRRTPARRRRPAAAGRAVGAA